MCTIMLGNPEMNLPGTFNYHDKGMQTIGVALKGGSPNQKHGFPPEGKSLESSVPTRKLSSSVRSMRVGRACAPYGTFLYLELP